MGLLLTLWCSTFSLLSWDFIPYLYSNNLEVPSPWEESSFFCAGGCFTFGCLNCFCIIINEKLIITKQMMMMMIWMTLVRGRPIFIYTSHYMNWKRKKRVTFLPIQTHWMSSLSSSLCPSLINQSPLTEIRFFLSPTFSSHHIELMQFWISLSLYTTRFTTFIIGSQITISNPLLKF